MTSPLGSRGRIFGVGLGRTGTASLAQALRLLGFVTDHFADYAAHLEHYEETGEVISLRLLTLQLREIQAIANGTGLPFRELDGAFPGSKFILTVREEESWLESKRAYAVLELSVANFGDRDLRAKRMIREGVYGSFEFDETLWLAAYQRRVSEVLHLLREPIIRPPHHGYSRRRRMGRAMSIPRDAYTQCTLPTVEQFEQRR